MRKNAYERDGVCLVVYTRGVIEKFEVRYTYLNVYMYIRRNTDIDPIRM